MITSTRSEGNGPAVGGLAIETWPLGPLDTNAYLIVAPSARVALLVDPGDASPELLDSIITRQLAVSAIVLTHGHADHIAGVDWFRDRLTCPVWVGEPDAHMLTDAEANLSAWLGTPFVVQAADRRLVAGDCLPLGPLGVEVIAVPGHTRGSIALVTAAGVICGDTLFAGGIGRTDLPGGDHPALLASIRGRLLTLSDRPVYPGHGPATTIATEAATNPLLD